MAEHVKLPVKLVMCPILRETDGLAMSSRNIHLSADERQRALVLSKTLFWLKQNFDRHQIPELTRQCQAMISTGPGLQLEYFELASAQDLQPANQNTPGIVALVAAKVGNTRLIDNVILQ